MDEVQTLDETNERKHSKMDIPQFIEPGKLGGWLLEGESIEDGMLAIKCRQIWNQYRNPSGNEGFYRDLKLSGYRMKGMVGKMAARHQPRLFRDIPIVWEHLTVIDCANCGSNVIEFWRGSSGEFSIHQQVQCCSEMKLAPAEDIPIQPIFER